MIVRLLKLRIVVCAVCCVKVLFVMLLTKRGNGNILFMLGIGKYYVGVVSETKEGRRFNRENVNDSNREEYVYSSNCP